MTTTAPSPHPTVQQPGVPVRHRRTTRGAVGAWALVVILACMAAVFAVWRVFVRTDHGQRVDQAALEGAHIGRSTLWQVAEPVLDVVSVGFIAAAVLACVLIALLRRRWSLAIAAGVVLAGANITTQVLKKWVLDRPDWNHGPDFNTLPSGHTTAAASVAAAVLIVVPPKARSWLAVLGAGYATATGVSTLIGQWHRPADVVAALLVVLAWGALSCVILIVGTGRRRDHAVPTAAVPVAAGALHPAGQVGDRVAVIVLLATSALATGAGGIALTRTWRATDPQADRLSLLTAYAGGVLGIAAVAALVFAILVVMRRTATAATGR